MMGSNLRRSVVHFLDFGPVLHPVLDPDPRSGLDLHSGLAGSLGGRTDLATVERHHPAILADRAGFATDHPWVIFVLRHPARLGRFACFPSSVAILATLAVPLPCGLVPSALGCGPSWPANRPDPFASCPRAIRGQSRGQDYHGGHVRPVGA